MSFADLQLSQLLRDKGVRDERTLAAIASLDRVDFVPAELASEATRDNPLAIGHGQTISQPFVVAAMTEALATQAGQRVLEVGTGSGYQAAVLARLDVEVFSVERIPSLAHDADERLQRLGFRNVHVRVGDGSLGWPEEAPFDAVMVTAAAARLPPALVEQLRPGGRLVAPLGPVGGPQELVLLHKALDGALRMEQFLPVQFVPLVEDAAVRS